MKKQIILILLFVWMLVPQSFATYSPDKEVLNAFELRTKGKVDDSRKLLESILSKDSTNAMAHYEMFLGNQPEADKWKEEATKTDKYFSKALGIPTILLFDSPDQISHHYFSFFTPF